MQTLSQSAKDSGAQMAAQWRRDAGGNNPAGPLFVGGAFAEADIISNIGPDTGQCGTGCSGSCIQNSRIRLLCC